MHHCLSQRCRLCLRWLRVVSSCFGQALLVSFWFQSFLSLPAFLNILPWWAIVFASFCQEISMLCSLIHLQLFTAHWSWCHVDLDRYYSHVQGWWTNESSRRPLQDWHLRNPLLPRHSHVHQSGHRHHQYRVSFVFAGFEVRCICVREMFLRNVGHTGIIFLQFHVHAIMCYRMMHVRRRLHWRMRDGFFLLCELAAARSQYLMPNRRWTLALEHVCFCALDAGGRIVPRLNDARLGWMLSLSIYAWLKNYTNINYWLCCTCNIINKGGKGFRAENRQNVAFESSVDTSR